MLSGQHFLVDEKILKKICDYAEVQRGERILEIGAGSGNLTEKLLERGGFVYAIEKDSSLVEKLKDKFSKYKNLEIIEGDALKIEFPRVEKVVSSLPFSISRKITEKLLMKKFEVGILVYQREFARKLIAKENSQNYKFISALSQSCAKIEILDEISPKAFEPSPRVVSSIVKIVQNMKIDREYIKFVHELFNQRNKKLRNILKCNLPKNFRHKRSFELSPEEINELYVKFYS